MGVGVEVNDLHFMIVDVFSIFTKANPEFVISIVKSPCRVNCVGQQVERNLAVLWKKGRSRESKSKHDGAEMWCWRRGRGESAS